MDIAQLLQSFMQKQQPQPQTPLIQPPMMQQPQVPMQQQLPGMQPQLPVAPMQPQLPPQQPDLAAILPLLQGLMKSQAPQRIESVAIGKHPISSKGSSTTNRSAPKPVIGKDKPSPSQGKTNFKSQPNFSKTRSKVPPSAPAIKRRLGADSPQPVAPLGMTSINQTGKTLGNRLLYE